MGVGVDRGGAQEDLELALRVTERIRSTLELEEVLRQTVRELGEACGASRSLLQLEPGADGTSLMIEYDRGDTRPLGYRPPTPIARRVFARGEPVVIDGNGPVEEHVAAYLAEVGTVSAVNYPIRWHGRVLAVLGFQDDRPRDWFERAVPLLELVEGQVAAALAQAELWRDQQRALAELENVNRMREELVANVSHELRTPLTAIVGVVKTLRRTDVRLGGDRVEQLLEILDDQSQRLALLAEDVLDLARFHAGEARLEPQRTSVARLAERSRAGLELPPGRRLRVDGLEDFPLVVDPHRIAQVLANLLVNAARHGQGDVSVGAERDGDTALLWVSDQGEGVVAERTEEIFEPFAHGGERTDSTGLGLSIARRIVEAHGGTLAYEPPDGDRPHRFAVRLPLAGPRRAADG